MNLSHKKTLHLLERAKDKLKQSDVIKDLCKEFNVDLNYIDLVPMAFIDLDVSARTDKGVIYFNSRLYDDFLEKNLHYAVHELRHHFDQCFGNGPTQGASQGGYLDNEFEQEGFQTQTKYLSETQGDEAAIEYVNKVINHHDVPPKARKQKIRDLLELV